MKHLPECAMLRGGTWPRDCACPKTPPPLADFEELGVEEVPDGEWGWGGRYRAAMLMKDPCWFCNKLTAGNRRFHCLDHLEPRSRGGPSEVMNYSGMCPDCNGEKASMGVLQFLAAKALMRQHGISGRKRFKRLAALVGPKAFVWLMGRHDPHWLEMVESA